MPLTTHCPGCDTQVSVPDMLASTSVKCPQCGRQFVSPDLPPPVPEPETVKAAYQSPLPSAVKPCVECGASIRSKAVVCPSCGVPQPGSAILNAANPAQAIDSSRVTAGILAILLGMFGIHKFYLGYKTEGIIMLLIAIIGSPCHGLGPLVMICIGIAEGVIYLSKTDAEFRETYEISRRGWF